jgi:hypothetical protein
MIESVPLYPSTIPLAFFVWGPAAVMVLFWLVGIWSSRQNVPRFLENDWNGYSVADVEKLFAFYGEDNRRRYRSRVLPADAAFACFYLIVGGVIVAGLAMRGQPWWVAALCGGGWLLGGIADVAENLTVAKLLDAYPKVEPGTVAFASRATQAKLVLFCVGIVGALVAAWLVFKPLAP